MKLNCINRIFLFFVITNILLSCTSDPTSKPPSLSEIQAATEDIDFPAQIALAALSKREITNKNLGTNACPFRNKNLKISETEFNQFAIQLVNEGVLNRALPLDNQQRLEAFKLVKSGQFKGNIQSSIEQVYQINNDLPLVALKEIQNPELLLKLPQAFAMDIARNPIKISSVPACTAEFTNFLNSAKTNTLSQNCHPQFLTNTMTVIYQDKFAAKATKTARIFTDEKNRSMRLALIGYARSNGINITEQDIDTLDTFLDTNKEPDLRPLVITGLRMFTEEYGLNDIQAAKEKIMEFNKECSINVTEQNNTIQPITYNSFEASGVHSIDWNPKGSNLSYFHDSADLYELAPRENHGKIESMYEQYERVFSSFGSTDYKKYTEILTKIVKKMREPNGMINKTNIGAVTLQHVIMTTPHSVSPLF